MYNGTEFEFILLGFPGFQDKESKSILTAFFFSAYILILLENFFIVIVIVADENLHKPMYVFICNLALVDVLITTIVIPKTLANLMFNLNTISFSACFVQTFAFLHGTTAQLHILAAMCYDRVIAVCNPLQYVTVMSNKLVITLLVLCWTVALVTPLVLLYFALQLSFCGPNKIPNYYCGHAALIKMSCTDYSINSVLGLVFGLGLLILHAIIFIISYGKIIVTVLKIKSADGHMKAFSTCGAHLFVVITTLLSAAFVYVSSRVPAFSMDARLMVATVQNLLCPVINPIIYSLMTKEIIESIKKVIQKNIIKHFQE
ncbi:olfactory receptor 13G1-like isoform X2 [Erpetoichthys calabaricus]|uniref:olfactory receptor 13G1-like isoform X2 n=1 Tax=Erpetoichthys calabaricus TaxID=27687 RepID=UPI0022345B4E|nr:olfactory receptor 13G1-like isoform X2 [Erpetoichthys calabaricus]